MKPGQRARWIRFHTGKHKFLVVRVPFLRRVMDAYNIVEDNFLRGKFEMFVGIGRTAHAVGVGRMLWLPGVVWSWSPTADTTSILDDGPRSSLEVIE